MVEENISQECRLKDVYETRNYFLEEIEQNELISIEQKKRFMQLQIIWNTLILASAIIIPNWFSYEYCKLCNRIKTLCNS